jgi:hypothetical protein
MLNSNKKNYENMSYPRNIFKNIPLNYTFPYKKYKNILKF